MWPWEVSTPRAAACLLGRISLSQLSSVLFIHVKLLLRKGSEADLTHMRVPSQEPSPSRRPHGSFPLPLSLSQQSFPTTLSNDDPPPRRLTFPLPVSLLRFLLSIHILCTLHVYLYVPSLQLEAHMLRQEDPTVRFTAMSPASGRRTGGESGLIRLPLTVMVSHDHRAVKSGGISSTRVSVNRVPCKARAAYK